MRRLREDSGQLTASRARQGKIGISGPVGPDGWLVRSSGAVEVLGFHQHIERLPDEKFLGFKVDALREAIEAKGHENFDVALLNALVL